MVAIEFLFEKYTMQCSVDVMAGHLTVVQLLHGNDIGQFSSRAMDGAAEFGHLEVVRFLHETRRSKGCMTDAMDDAIVNGHLEVVKFLHENRTEAYTAAAMNRAARNYWYSAHDTFT